MAVALWHVLQTLCLVLALLFSILALATESWSQISVSLSSNPTSVSNVCSDASNFCFILPVAVDDVTEAEVSTAMTNLPGIGHFQRPPHILLLQTTLTLQYSTLVVILGLSASELQIAGTSLKQGALKVQVSTNEIESAQVVPEAKNVVITTDVGLFKECFSTDLPLPGFSLPLAATSCFTKASLCGIIRSDEAAQMLSNNVLVNDGKKLQSDMSDICNKMTATAVLSSLSLFAIVLVCLVVLFPLLRRCVGGLGTLYIQAGVAVVAAVLSLSAIAVWASTVVDARGIVPELSTSMTESVKNQLNLQLEVSMGYSLGFQISALVLLAFTVLITFLGLKKVPCALHPCCGRKEQKVAFSISSDNEDDDEDFLTGL